MKKVEYKKYEEYQKVVEIENKVRALRDEINDLQSEKARYLSDVIAPKIEADFGIKKGDVVKVAINGFSGCTREFNGVYDSVRFEGCAYPKIRKLNKKGEASKVFTSITPCLDLEAVKFEVVGHVEITD